MANPMSTVVRTVVEYSPALVNGVLTTNTCSKQGENQHRLTTCAVSMMLQSTVNIMWSIILPYVERTPVRSCVCQAAEYLLWDYHNAQSYSTAL